MKKLKFLTFILLVSFLLVGCNTIQVSGKTFRYHSVSIDWGLADEQAKNALFEENQVANEAELLNVLKTRNNRNTRYTTFGTNNQYTTKNAENEIIDSGYYKQDESIITLAETEEGLNDNGAYTLQVNEKGYVVTVKLNDEYKIFAKYQYVEQD